MKPVHVMIFRYVRHDGSERDLGLMLDQLGAYPSHCSTLMFEVSRPSPSPMTMYS